jgi:hypothetical protein
MRKTLLISILVLTLAAGMSTPARAAASIEGSGTYSHSNLSLTPIRTFDGTTYYNLSFTDTLTGILTASCTLTGTLAVHADGSANGSGLDRCTGTVAGHPGPFLLGVVASISAGGAATGWFVLRGSGPLQGVYGHGTVQGTLIAGTMAVLVHFDL